MKMTIQKYVRLNNPDEDLSIEESDGGLEQIVTVTNMEIHDSNVDGKNVVTFYTEEQPNRDLWSVTIDMETFQELKSLT